MRAGGKGTSPGKLSLLFLIVKAVALVIFRSQDVAPPFDKLSLIEKLSLKLYRQLHVFMKLVMILTLLGVDEHLHYIPTAIPQLAERTHRPIP